MAFPQDRDTEYSEEELGGQSPGLEARSPELESGSVFWIWDSWARDLNEKDVWSQVWVQTLGGWE